MIYATKKKGESNERLMNRFKQVVQRSRLILKTKQERFHKRKLKKRVVRISAVKRADYRAAKTKQQFYS